MDCVAELSLVSSNDELATLSIFLKGCCGNLMQAFRTLDTQNVGYLTLESFREGLERLGFSGDVESLFRSTDINQTESVSSEVFMSCLNGAEEKFGETLSWGDESQTSSLQKIAAMLAMSRRQLGIPTPLREDEGTVNFEPNGPNGAIYLNNNMERIQARTRKFEVAKPGRAGRAAERTLEDTIKRHVEHAIKGILGNEWHGQKSPTSTRCTSGASEDDDHQCHQFSERQNETTSARCEPSAFESNAKQLGPKQMKSFELRLETVEKAMMEVDTLSDSLRVVERNVQGLFAHRSEHTEMITSLAEFSKNNDKITEVYRMLPEVALVAEEAKQTRMQLRQSFEQLDALETRVKGMKASAETHSTTLDDIRRAVRKEQKDREEWCSISKRAIQNIEAFCTDMQYQLPALAKNQNEHSKRFLPEMSSSVAQFLLNDARMLVNEACPTLPARCGARRTTTSIAASLESILSSPLPGADGGSTPRLDFINSGVERKLPKQPVSAASLRSCVDTSLHISTLGLVSKRGEVV